jgi:hypothetical protein
MSPSKGRPPVSGGASDSASGGRLGSIAALAIAAGLTTIGGADAQPTTVGDRYSGEVYIRPAYADPAPPAAPLNGPLLSWPGKTAPAAAQLETQQAPPPAARSAVVIDPLRAPSYRAYPAASPPTVQTPYSAPAQPARDRSNPASVPAGGVPAPLKTAYTGPPVHPWYERYGAPSAQPSSDPLVSAPRLREPASLTGPSAPSPSQAPKSIYDAPAVQPVAAAADAGETVRYYSLHRPYGLTPDPDPIPPQAFTQTADLSDPPGPDPVDKAASSAGGAGGATTAGHAQPATSTPARP